MNKLSVSFFLFLILLTFGCINLGSTPTYVCPDGSTVSSPNFCKTASVDSGKPATSANKTTTQPSTVYICPDGSNATSMDQCKKYVCANGSTVSLPSLCNVPSSTTSPTTNVTPGNQSTPPAVIYVCPDGSNATSLSLCPKYVCSNGTIVSAPGLCPTVIIPPTTNTSTNTTSNTSTPPANLTKPICNGTVYSALTSNLQAKSTECGKARIYDLCGKCSTCCVSYSEPKSEYNQQMDATCYSCAATNYNVSRARDYYGMLGAYEKKCTPLCTTTLVPAYKALLQYAQDNSCNISAGYQFCNDVTLG